MASETGRGLQSLRSTGINAALLRGQMVYTQRGHTLRRYDIDLRRITGRWNVGRAADYEISLEDIRAGIAVYVFNEETISLLRLKDGRKTSVPIPESATYELWSADGAAFGGGGLYYQYSEQRETNSNVLDRSIVHFIPQARVDALFRGG